MLLEFVDPRGSPSGPWAGPPRRIADSVEELEALHRSCREGRVYGTNVSGWTHGWADANTWEGFMRDRIHMRHTYTGSSRR